MNRRLQPYVSTERKIFELQQRLVKVKTRAPRAGWVCQAGRSKAFRAATELFGRHTLFRTVRIVELVAIAIS
jgi:hypothetical protein